MLSPLFALVYFLPFSLAASVNSTADCPSGESTVCNQRTVVGLLTSCGLTLLICVFHAIHPPLPLPCWKWYHILKSRFRFMLVTFITPELTIASAVEEWCKVRQVTKDARRHGCEWWTRSHSHFILNGGFVLCDSSTGLREIKVDEFLQLWSAKELINPVITGAEIQDKSSSNSLAKALLLLQLSWFMTQVVVRAIYHFVVTLIELDTVCMALLTLPLIFCWWNKPFCATRPHIFYKRDASPRSPEVSTKGSDSQLTPSEVSVTIASERNEDDFLFPTAGSSFVPLCATWMIFGALHLVAWNYEFLTVPEKFLWRMASLALSASPVIYLLSSIVRTGRGDTKILCLILVMLTSITSRLLLVALMLASLRSLPSSAYQILPWTSYIPHL